MEDREYPESVDGFWVTEATIFWAFMSVLCSSRDHRGFTGWAQGTVPDLESESDSMPSSTCEVTTATKCDDHRCHPMDLRPCDTQQYPPVVQRPRPTTARCGRCLDSKGEGTSLSARRRPRRFNTRPPVTPPSGESVQVLSSVQPHPLSMLLKFDVTYIYTPMYTTQQEIKFESSGYMSGFRQR